MIWKWSLSQWTTSCGIGSSRGNGNLYSERGPLIFLLRVQDIHSKGYLRLLTHRGEDSRLSASLHHLSREGNITFAERLSNVLSFDLFIHNFNLPFFYSIPLLLPIDVYLIHTSSLSVFLTWLVMSNDSNDRFSRRYRSEYRGMQNESWILRSFLRHLYRIPCLLGNS